MSKTSLKILDQPKTRQKVEIGLGLLKSAKEQAVISTAESLLAKNLLIVGDTGSGKSHTAARIIGQCCNYNPKIILYNPTNEIVPPEAGVENIANIDMPHSQTFNFSDHVQGGFDPAMRCSRIDNAPDLEDILQGFIHDPNIKVLQVTLHSGGYSAHCMLESLLLTTLSERAMAGLFSNKPTLFAYDNGALLRQAASTNHNIYHYLAATRGSGLASLITLSPAGQLTEELLTYFGSLVLHTIKHRHDLETIEKGIASISKGQIAALTLQLPSEALLYNFELKQPIAIQIFNPETRPRSNYNFQATWH